MSQFLNPQLLEYLTWIGIMAVLLFWASLMTPFLGIFGGPDGPSGVIKSHALVELLNNRSIDLYAFAPFSLLEPLIMFQPQFVAIWDIISASL